MRLHVTAPVWEHDVIKVLMSTIGQIFRQVRGTESVVTKQDCVSRTTGNTVWLIFSNKVSWGFILTGQIVYVLVAQHTLFRVIAVARVLMIAALWVMVCFHCYCSEVHKSKYLRSLGDSASITGATAAKLFWWLWEIFRKEIICHTFGPTLIHCSSLSYKRSGLQSVLYQHVGDIWRFG